MWLVPWLRWQEQKLSAPTHIYRVEGFSLVAGDPFSKKRDSSGKSHICQGKTWGRKNENFKPKNELEPLDRLSAWTDALENRETVAVQNKGGGYIWIYTSLAQGIAPELSQRRALHGGKRGRLSHWVFWYTSAWVWGLSFTSSPCQTDCSHPWFP